MAIKAVNSKITKIVAEDIVVPDDTKNGAILGTYTGKCCDAAAVNNNDMKLGRELFEVLFDSEDFQRAMEYGHYLGFLGHPEDPGCQDYEHCCIVMRDCKIEDNDEIIGTFDVLDTPVGRIVKTLEDAGVQLGISIRGAGDVDIDGNVDPETFVFRGFDLVTFPAYDDAIPTFQALAASSEVEKQVAYKMICSAIDKNMEHINVSAASELQKNFNSESDEYKKLEARKADIGTEDPETSEELSEEDKLEVIGKKLECMTDLYMDTCYDNEDLKAQIKSCKSELNAVKAASDRKFKHLERITRSQQKLMKDRVTAATEKYEVTIKANTELKRKLANSNRELTKVQASNSAIMSELNTLKNSNLIYKQKIECSNADIEDRDKTISNLRSELDKTVITSTEAIRKASDFDEEVKHLKSEVSASTKTISDLQSRVVAAEDLLAQYQQAYADIYATALGTSVSGLRVTASTSVSDLENLIQGATNTSNVGVNPDYDMGELLPEVIDVLDDAEYDAGLVTL